MKFTSHEPSKIVEHMTASVAPKRAWKKALSTLGGPLMRLHHYRDVRTKVLHDAIFMRDRQRCDVHPADCESARR